ncbi:DUF2399 domain-containing protein [Acidaminobacter sp. JC074]|uniref:Wadjet anti-phage system protein JetD domain-containing protein n=1 Tax=Acidaminobacter sp. JC074 TaxID=2530199 RepID=UPI001F0D8979|nr:Wadjet anti-phage system protein JetD domain-containing protein [Acidaminobacter sp. JC074]MCH4891153.1 DUF2399 domain-containing protein [Acidaminobacter sp. JC074]
MTLEKELILKLIAKYEKSKAFSGPSNRAITIKASEIKGYNDSYDKKHQIHEAVYNLQAKHFISVQWQKYEKNNILEKLILNIDCLDEIYKMYKYESKHTRLDQASDDLLVLEACKWQYKDILISDIKECLNTGRFHRLWPDDKMIRNDMIIFIKSLDEIDEITERMYSLKYYSDSKYFEKHVRSKAVSILKAYSDLQVEDEELLESIGIVKNPTELFIKGPLRMKLDHEIDLSVFKYGTSINRETIKHIEWMKVDAKKLMTIENKAVYYEYIKTSDDDELVIYLGGFFGKSTRQFLKLLDVDKVDAYHFGDIDLGGFRIYDYLSKFIKVKPYKMDVESLMSKLDYTLDFSKSYEKQLRSYKASNFNTCFSDVIDYMLENHVRLEQEAFYI